MLPLPEVPVQGLHLVLGGKGARSVHEMFSPSLRQKLIKCTRSLTFHFAPEYSLRTRRNLLLNSPGISPQRARAGSSFSIVWLQKTR